jgi:DNA-binding transcriptional LysR family regulator
MTTQDLRAQRKRLADLTAFAAVAEAQSFTKAAARLGVSQSALSHLVRQMEAQLGVRLLARTTRSVAPTAAGEALLQRLTPALDDIDEALAAVGRLRDAPHGVLRITCFKLAAQLGLWPLLQRFHSAHPGIELELQISDQLVDIVAERFDAGIRFASRVEQDMVGVPIGPPLRFITVAAPDYLRRHGQPKQPAELLSHACLRYRFSSSGELFPWHFRQSGRRKPLAVQGPLISNDSDSLLQAAVQGLGIAQLYDGLAADALARGELVQILPSWVPPPARLLLYHPSRRQIPAPLQALIQVLRA